MAVLKEQLQLLSYIATSILRYVVAIDYCLATLHYVAQDVASFMICRNTIAAYVCIHFTFK